MDEEDKDKLSSYGSKDDCCIEQMRLGMAQDIGECVLNARRAHSKCDRFGRLLVHVPDRNGDSTKAFACACGTSMALRKIAMLEEGMLHSVER